MPGFVLVEQAEGLATVTVSRPEKLNALNAETVQEIGDVFHTLARDEGVRAVVLTGAGEKAFVAGADIAELSRMGPVGGVAVSRQGQDAFRFIELMRKPVIAAVNGYAIGGGHVLHVLCDLSIAAETARFGQVGPRVGSVDPGFGTAYMARVVGEKRAREIWFLCRQYSAQEALAMNLVNAVVPLADLEAEGVRWADEILEMSPTAIRFLKASFLVATDGLAGMQEFAGHATGLYYTTDEAHEGSQAFLAKRKPEYRKYPRRP